MSATIGIAAMLLGGWVLADGDSQGQLPPSAGPQSYSPGPIGGSMPGGSPVVPPSVQPGAGGVPPGYGQGPAYYGPPPGHGPSHDGSRPPGSMPGARPGLPQAGHAALGEPQPMPVAPTDPDAAGDVFPWGAPTDSSPLDLRDLPNPSAATGGLSSYSSLRAQGARAYTGPRVSRPGYQKYTSVSPEKARERMSSVSAAAVHGPQLNVTKPFSGYNPGPAISPYVELFRRDTTSSVDNYNALVKPLLDQQIAARQLNRQLSGLQKNSQHQAAALRKIGRQTLKLQGITTPQYYMNTGGYYPSW